MFVNKSNLSFFDYLISSNNADVYVYLHLMDPPSLDNWETIVRNIEIQSIGSTCTKLFNKRNEHWGFANTEVSSDPWLQYSSLFISPLHPPWGFQVTISPLATCRGQAYHDLVRTRIILAMLEMLILLVAISFRNLLHLSRELGYEDSRFNESVLWSVSLTIPFNSVNDFMSSNHHKERRNQFPSDIITVCSLWSQNRNCVVSLV